MKKRNLLLLLLLSPNIVFAATEYIDCGKIAIPSPIAPVTRTIILLLQIVLPMGLIILGSLDFVKSTTANEDKIKKHQQRFVKRLISAAVVFMVISIAKIVTNMVSDGGNIATCLDCLTSKKASCGSVTFNPFDLDYSQQQDIYIPGLKQPGLDKDKYDKNENNNPSNSSNPSNPSTPSNYDKFIFSGDSKTVGMCGSKDTTGCNTQDWQGNSLCGDANVSACGGKSYAWFRDNALSQITAKTSGGGYNIILWWGVNDTGNSKTYSSTWAKNYYNQYKNYADTEWKQNNIYVVGISPLRNDTEEFTNAKVNSFNKDMKSMINSSGSSNLRFCDISSISFTKNDYVDFVHHSKSGYEKVYNYIRNNCVGK